MDPVTKQQGTKLPKDTPAEKDKAHKEHAATHSTGEKAMKFKLAICGGGIAGMALAALLSKSKDISIDLYEKEPEIRLSEGAGLAVWKRYWKLLDELLNFNEAFVAKNLTTPGWDGVTGPRVRRSDNPAGGKQFYQLDHGFKSFPRPQVMDVLKSKIDSDICNIITNKSIRKYTILENKSIMLHFKDDTTTKADLLIGADGVHSRVRNTMFGPSSPYASSRFSGQYAYRMAMKQAEIATTNTDHPALKGLTFWCGQTLHFITTAIGPPTIGPLLISLYETLPKAHPAIRPPNVESVPMAHVLEQCPKWEPHLLSALSLPTACSKWAIYTLPHLPTFIAKGLDGPAGNVALIGDAAHAMLPHQGLGACQGIEDAYVLSLLLSSPLTNKTNLATALEIYDEVRRPLAQKVADSSRVVGELLDFTSYEHVGDSDEEWGEAMGGLCEWLRDEGGTFAVGERAMDMLEGKA